MELYDTRGFWLFKKICSIFHTLLEKQRDKLSLSKEQTLKIAEQNNNNTFILLHIVFSIEIIKTIIFFIKYHGYSRDEKVMFNYLFFLLFICILLLLVNFLIKKSKTDNIFLQNLSFYTSMLFAFGCSVYRTIAYDDILIGIIIYSLISIVILTFCNPEPRAFSCYAIIPAIFFFMQIYSVHNFRTANDFILFYIVLCILAFFKRSIIKRDYERENQLKTAKESLEKEFAKQSAELEYQAIELLHQNKKVMKIQDETIIGLSNLVENRDEDTGQHVKRTSKYVYCIALKAFEKKLYKSILDENFIELIQKAAPMHDIGKIIIPDAILKKPARLTPEEFEKIKLHTVEGYRIVQEVLGKSEEPDYISMASDVALSHHEKWNGEGYPRQLKGEQIPLSARIMAIADVFDALISHRCYKPAMSYEEAFTTIKESSGTHFDPELVNIFLENSDEIIKISERYK